MIVKADNQELKTVLHELRKFCKDGIKKSENFLQLFPDNPLAKDHRSTGQQWAYTDVLDWATQYLRTQLKKSSKHKMSKRRSP